LRDVARPKPEPASLFGLPPTMAEVSPTEGRARRPRWPPAVPGRPPAASGTGGGAKA